MIHAKRSVRIHALDALRVILMCLGFLFHSIFFLQGFSYEGVFSVIKIFLHLFRMPAFFMLAGYFAQMLYRRYGFWGFFFNRQRRLLVPLIVLMALVTLPHMIFILIIYLGQLSLKKPVFPLSDIWHVNISLSYYWFILYLFAMELMFFTFKGVLNIVSGKCSVKNMLLYKPYLQFISWLVIFVLSIIFLNIKPLLYFSSAFDGFGELMVLHFGYYFCFFICGVLLFNCYRQKHIRVEILLWFFVSCVSFAGYYAVFFSNIEFKLHVVSCLQCLFAWSMSLFLWNLSYFSFNYQKSWLRYLSEASYSLYLLQIPIMIILFKYVVVSYRAYFNSLSYAVLSFFVSLCVYHWFIRDKWYFRYIDGFQRIHD